MDVETALPLFNQTSGLGSRVPDGRCVDFQISGLQRLPDGIDVVSQNGLMEIEKIAAIYAHNLLTRPADRPVNVGMDHAIGAVLAKA